MKKLINKLNSMFIRAKLEKDRVLSNERGDTNFISIAIILVIVIAVAVIFIGFRDDVVEWFNKSTGVLDDALNGTETAAP